MTLQEKKEKLRNKLENKKAYAAWYYEMYSKILFCYIHGTAKVEQVMNYCITYHFIKYKKRSLLSFELTEEFEGMILKDMRFRTKYSMFRALMEKSHKSLFEKHLTPINEFGSLYKTRNDLAHATIYAPPDTMSQKSYSRVMYFNPSVSINPCEITWERAHSDAQKLERLFHIFFEIETQLRR